MIKLLSCSALVLSAFGGAGAQRGDYKCPLAGSPEIRGADTVASTGGRFDSARGNGHKHGALDLNSSEGADVFAVRAGQAAVASSDWGVLGGTVIIDHGDGEYSVYAHLSDISVAQGAKVNAGDKVGAVGYTGNAAALRDADYLRICTSLSFAATDRDWPTAMDHFSSFETAPIPGSRSTRMASIR